MSTTGVWMIGLAGIAIILVGGRFLIAPAAGAKGFGLETSAIDPYLRVKGIRDVVSGMVVLVLVWISPRHTLAVVTCVLALIPLGDCAVVLSRGGPRSIALGVHLTTAIYMLVAAALLVG